jgi:hypothetical protein
VQLKLHPAFATILIAGIIILVFTFIRGCNNSRQAIALNKELIIKNDSLAAQVIREKIINLENKKEYEIKLEVANGQVEIKENQVARTEADLNAANKRINILLAKHHDISPSDDTSITVVPNEFINDCNGCFTELENGQKLVQQYKIDNDQLKLSLRVKDKLQTDRIGQQEQEKAKLVKSLNDCMTLSKSAQKAAEPHGQLYFSWNVIWSPLPIGASIGLAYQNKHKLQYGLRGGYGTFGKYVETEMNLPLSLRRKRF